MNFLEATGLKLRFVGDLFKNRADFFLSQQTGALSPIAVGSGVFFIMMNPVLYHFNQFVLFGRRRWSLTGRMIMVRMGVCMVLLMFLVVIMVMMMTGMVMVVFVVMVVAMMAAVAVTFMIMVMMAHLFSSFVAIDPVCRLC